MARKSVTKAKAKAQPVWTFGTCNCCDEPAKVRPVEGVIACAQCVPDRAKVPAL